MQILQHLCGQVLERGTNGAYFHLTPVRDRVMRGVKVDRCPRCNELLDDTDMRDGAGVPLVVDGLPAWGVVRRALLTDLATAGYVLRWADGAWHIRQAQRDQDAASAATLDAIIERARAITTGTDPGGGAPMAA